MLVGKNLLYGVKGGNAEEEMYKELFKATVERTSVDGGYMDLVDLNLTSIGWCAYSHHYYIGQVNLPNVTAAGQQAFDSAKIHGNINLPDLTHGGYRMFTECYFYGTEIRLPKVTSITNQLFYTALQWGRVSTTTRPTVYLDSCTTLNNNAFYGASGMAKLYAPRITSLSGSGTFTGLGNASAAGAIELIVGSREFDTGLTMAGLVASAYFPFGASTSGRVTFTCKDGTVTYQSGAWVQTPFS